MERADHNNIPTQDIRNSNPSKMTNIPILSKKLLKKQRKKQKQSFQVAARKRIIEKLGPLPIVPHIPDYIKEFKRKYTFSQISDIMNLDVDCDYLAMDCEFVTTTAGNALGRVAIVDFCAKTVYQSFSKPECNIVDYKTRWSGLREKDLDDAPPFEQVRQSVLSIIKDKIVIGHAVANDFRALQIVHPSHLVLDTLSIRWIRDLALQANESGRSLKKLSMALLNINMQTGEHCPIEDAKCTMKLFRLVFEKWSGFIKFRNQEFIENLYADSNWDKVKNAN